MDDVSIVMNALAAPRSRPNRAGAAGFTPRPRDGGLSRVELIVTLLVASLVSIATDVFFPGQQRL